MIKNTKSICNEYGIDLIAIMNNCDKGLSHFDCHLNFSRPTWGKGYFDLLATALQYDTFKWSDLILHSNARNNVIRRYERNIKHWSRQGKYVSLEKYATNYFNSYKTFFRNYGLIEQVKDKPRGYMRLTWLGSDLIKTLYATKNK